MPIGPARRDLRPAPGSRWVGLGGTLAVYGVVACAVLLTMSSRVVRPVPPVALTVMDMRPPAAPPQTPPRPRTAPVSVAKGHAVRQSFESEPLPEIRVQIPPVAPPPVIEPRPADPAPRPEESTASRAPPAPSAPHATGRQAETWEGQVLAQLAKKRRYPMGAMARREQGVPWVRFVMDRQGRVLSASLERSSGMPDLDREALSLPGRAQPLPKPPEDRPGETLELVVPVEFSIR